MVVVSLDKLVGMVQLLVTCIKYAVKRRFHNMRETKNHHRIDSWACLGFRARFKPTQCIKQLWCADLKTQFIDVNQNKIAYHHLQGASDRPGVMWLGGYRSDMQGTKALELEAHAKEIGISSTRHDYSGHGESGGVFIEGTISAWLEQSLEVMKQVTSGRQILVGSSMGAWVALRMVEELRKIKQSDRIAGLLLLAPAPDFTVELMEPELTDAQKHDLETKGYYEEPTPYGPEPNKFTKALFDDGRLNRTMMTSIDTQCPIHIIQGQQDPDVPWQHAQRLFELMSKDDASLTYVKDGDHRLSRPEDIALMKRVLDDLLATIARRVD